MSKNNYYKVLGIDSSVPAEQIKKAWKNLEYEVHPDRHPDDPGMAARFRMGKDAYDCLSNPSRRAAHDALLAQQARPAHPKVRAAKVPGRATATKRSARPRVVAPRRNKDNGHLGWVLLAVILRAAAGHYAKPANTDPAT